MKLSRRDVLAAGAGGLAMAMAAPWAAEAASAAAFDDALNKFTGGAKMAEGGVTLNAPEIAENGNTVPISIDAPGATEVMIMAPKNPTPVICTFKFGPLAASRKAATRVRLAGTQEVSAIAKMADGSFKMVKVAVKVTVGGCGG